MKRFATLIAGAVLATGAMADTTVPVSFTTGLLPMELSSAVTTLGPLAKFDSMLGTLTGATITLNAAIEGDITLTYAAAATASTSIRGNTTSDIFFASSIGALTGLFSPASLAYNTGFQTLNPGDTWTSATLTDSSSVSVAVSGAALSELVGPGSFTVSCESLSGFGTTGGGGFSGGSQNTFGECGVSIVYTFDPAPPPVVPEPGSLALVGLALAGLAGVSRKAKKA